MKKRWIVIGALSFLFLGGLSLLYLYRRAAERDKGPSFDAVILSLPDLKPLFHFKLSGAANLNGEIEMLLSKDGSKLVVGHVEYQNSERHFWLDTWQIPNERRVARIDLEGMASSVEDGIRLSFSAAEDCILVFGPKGKTISFRFPDLKKLETRKDDSANSGKTYSFARGPYTESIDTLELVEPGKQVFHAVWAVPHCQDGDWSGAVDPSGRAVLLPSVALETTQKEDLGRLTVDIRNNYNHWQAHIGAIFSVDMVASGQRVATGGQDRMAKLWDGGTGKLIRSFPHDAHVSCVRLSPDGKHLATVEDRGKGPLRIWDSETGATLAKLKIPLPKANDASTNPEHSATSTFIGPTLLWHPHQPWLLLPLPSGLEIRDGQDGHLVRRLPYPSWTDRALAWSPDGARLAVLQKSEILLLDSESFDVVQHLPMPGKPKVEGEEESSFEVSRVAFRDGQLRFNAAGTELLWYGGACETGYGDTMEEWACVWSLDGNAVPLHGKLDDPEIKKALQRFNLPRSVYDDCSSKTIDGNTTVSGVGLSARFH